MPNHGKISKIALITGITGQDGSYLSELLLSKGYQVHGIIRRSSTFNTSRIDHIYNKIHLHYGDMTDSLSLEGILQKVNPSEIYHLAAQSHVRASFDIPDHTGQVDATGNLRLIEAIRRNCPNAKFYNATTSELFGLVQEIPQKETTPFYPRSPYGVAKLYSYWIAKNYRESYNMFISNGILFNHESERRGETFVTRKITMGLAKITKRIQDDLSLGNLDAKRDWGYTPDFVEGMWQILQQDKPEDYVLATNETHSIREFVEESIKVINNWIEKYNSENPFSEIVILAPDGKTQIKKVYDKFDFEWRGEGENEIGFCKNRKRAIIKIDPKYYRPAEVDLLIGDYSKAKNELGWEPKVKFKELVKIMMKHDIENI